ncbi:cysteine desulfurase-like protein [Modestobacter sp. I12A-02628]|uniref:Cysteine desulfurase-like protein n=1 Tax=Goekera deserti TaxID=2497753 RepID=A0A7K3WFE4_9ACTN|nr:cysteine desulfurase-like protein [Goekera deserti]MPQ97839.1 cysteine desulfurase-like protein [Goekera deserti]NDI48484.1 cysteine desulfurase-like protein [Goekera deserti]NEL55137.1 cysteine desulfurase-like protein [Goekera deserti]
MSRGGSELDVPRVRGLFPALSDGFVHADGPGGALVPESVGQAVSQAMRVPIADRGGVFPSSGRAEALVSGARSAVADLVGARAAGVVLGPNMTTLTYGMARVLSRTWRPGDEIVVSRLDHDANVRPWVQRAEEVGVGVRWAEVDIETGELPAWQYDELLSERTQLVAVTAASSAIGTRPDVAGIAARAHQVGALVYVDAAHAVPHLLVDQRELDADFLAVSAYKWGGPHVGAVVADPALLGQLWPDQLAPGTDRVPDRFETGAPPYELYAGVAASVEHLAALCPDTTGPRRARLAVSMAAVGRYEAALQRRLERGLRSLPHVQVLGAAERRTPTVSFTVAGRRPRQVTAQLARRNVCAWDGDAGARELFDAFGVADSGGAVRLGLMHYSTVEEVDHLLQCVADLR